MSGKLARLAPLVVGVMIMIGALFVLADREPTCRGAAMRPGDTCVKTDGSAYQTYDQRIAAARTGGFVMLGTGLAVVGFGVVLVARARRTSG